jgi:hypothetical protein
MLDNIRSIHINFHQFMYSFEVRIYLKKSNNMFKQQFLIHQS